MNTIPPTPPNREAETIRVPTSRKRIFYVEADEDSAMMMKILLAQSGYEVVVAPSMEEGYGAIKKERFDAILLGNWFETGSGHNLCRQIREDNPQLPIVVYSGAAFQEDIEEGLKAGADVYLLKPNGLEVIEETIARLLGDKTRGA